MKPYYQDDLVTLYQADALDLLASLSDGSVDLIATDPPYFQVKDEPWDNAWNNAAAFLAWVGQLCVEWRRVLKPNGSLFVFASPEMERPVASVVEQQFRVLNVIRWEKDAGWHRKTEKEALQSFLSPWEAIVFAEHLPSVFGDEPDALLKQASAPLAQYIKQERERAGVVRQAVAKALAERGIYKNEQTGAAMCSDWEYGDSLPPERAYECLREVLNVTGGDFLPRKYADIAQEFAALRDKFRELRRPFGLTESAPWSDIWRFDTVGPYPGKHPCEKPMTLCEHIIRTSSRPNSVVLDTFCGSGALLEAARNLGRRAIGGDTSPRWCEWSAQRLSQQPLFGDVA